MHALTSIALLTRIPSISIGGLSIKLHIKMLGGLERNFSVPCRVYYMHGVLHLTTSLLVCPSVAHLVTYVQKCNTSTIFCEFSQTTAGFNAQWNSL